jgi:UrcA family protein
MNITKSDGNNKVQVILAIFAAVCVAVLANTTQAGDVRDAAPQLVVRYADLNLASHAGVAVLYRRIKNAASQVCGSVDLKHLSQAAAAKPCIDGAIAQAVSAINSPMLTSQYLAKTGSASTLTIVAAR